VERGQTAPRRRPQPFSMILTAWNINTTKFASPRPYTFHPSFTEGLRLFNTEPRGKVYSVDGPGSTAVFLSELPESLGLAAGRSPLLSAARFQQSFLCRVSRVHSLAYIRHC
jgi:hypothetical protein